jgi:hypothetical protein
MTDDFGRRSVVPFGSAYGVENLLGQEALKHASIVVLDETLVALGQAFTATEMASLTESHADSKVRQTLARLRIYDREPLGVSDRLPPVYANRYGTIDFLKNWTLTLAVVGWKLAQPEKQPLTNVAEEVALHVLIDDAIGCLDFMAENQPDAARAEATESLKDLYDSAFEDNDFLELYDLETSDDVRDLDPDGSLGMTDLRLKHWFQPFGSGTDRGVPHPFLLD